MLGRVAKEDAERKREFRPGLHVGHGHTNMGVTQVHIHMSAMRGDSLIQVSWAQGLQVYSHSLTGTCVYMHICIYIHT